MLKNKITAGILAAAMLTGTMPAVLAAEETETINAAVSGYVSTESGTFTLVNGDTVPTIYVDSTDYEGVIRAAGDLAGDVEKVTGKASVMVAENIVRPIGGSSGINITDDAMTVTFDYPVTEEGQCYVATYNADGTLAGVKMSTGLTDVGYEFDGVLKRPMGGTIKAFVWDENQKPVEEPLGMVVKGKVDTSKASVIIGTLGQSEAVDTLALSGELDVKEIEGKWESFTIQQVDESIVIAGSDKRGTIYGIYDLCEKIGVSPWHFWADTVIGHADSLYVNLPDGGYTEGEPSVKYRGIFLNDEFNMTEWSKTANGGSANMGNEVYKNIFELLLRLKANYLWPAMHKYSTAFNVTAENAALADEYGIVMGSSHCEPILRNNLGELYTYQQEWVAANPDKPLWSNTEDDSKRTVAWMWTDKDNNGNTVYNKDFLKDYWKARAQANGGYENTYTLGMRGVHDGQFSTNMDAMTALREIIAAQTEILTNEVAKDGKDISEVPQVFIPYKEMLDYYNKGLEIPDYVTLMWTDDNFGYIRQLPTAAERERSGGAGVYYHMSYYGRPMSYLWLGTTQPGLIREEMTKAYDMGAQEIWVANVGDLKPAETEIEYFLDLARDVDSVREADIGERLAENAKRDFGFNDAQAAEYADIKMGYYELANSRRPEHMSAGIYSLTDFGDEGQKELDRYSELVDRAQALYDGLSADKQPSFYELQLYPLKSAYNMAKKYIAADKAAYYANNGYGAAANKYAAESNAANQAIVDDTAAYTSMLDGKWDKMMNPFQTQLRGSTFGGTITGALSPATVSKVPYTEMKIIAEGGAGLSFTNYSTDAKFIDIINIGSGSLDWRATSDSEWITLNKTRGTVADNDRVHVGIDTSKITENAEGYITFERVIGETAVETWRVRVSFTNVQLDAQKEKAYIESDGYVSIEAEHYTNSVVNGVYEWKTEKDFGRSGDSVKAYPNVADKVSTPNIENSAYLEYEVYFTSEGTFPIEVYRMPTINELSGASLRFRIGVDDGTPVTFSGTTKTANSSVGTDPWGKGVMQNTEVLTGNIKVPSAGWHTVRLYNEDAGVVIDKFVITTGEKKASYYGAPESYNTTYNNSAITLPKATTAAQTQTGSVTAFFEPSMLIAGAIADTKVNVVNLNGVNESAILVVAAYDADGNMIDATYTPFAIGDTPISGAVTVEYTMPSAEGATEIQYMIIADEFSFDPIAPSVTVPHAIASPMASYDSGYVYPVTSMKDYIGKESVCVIVDKGMTDLENIQYIRQNTVEEGTYDKILFAGQGQFDLKVKVSGVDEQIVETLNTVINIRTDTDVTSAELYNWNFDTDQTGTGTNVPVLGGNALYNDTYKCIRLTNTSDATGSLTVDFDKAITAAHGETLTVVSKIAYGNLREKHMYYDIVDSNGKSIVRSEINRYTGKTQSLKIGGVEQLIDGSYPSAIQKVDGNNSPPTGLFSTWTITIDFAANRVYVKVSNDKNQTVNEYEGKLPDGTSYDIKKLAYTTNYNNQNRSCYVDDISITKSKAASYTMAFMPVVSGTDEAIENAEVTVRDKVTGAVVAAEADGTYKLCDGVYEYVVSAEGYQTASNVLELSASTESKEIKVEMTAE